MCCGGVEDMGTYQKKDEQHEEEDPAQVNRGRKTKKGSWRGRERKKMAGRREEEGKQS